jgi:hypothetical protein
MSQAPPDPMALLLGQSRRGRSISFRGTAPVWHRGLQVLAAPSTEQARDPETGEGKFFPIKGTRDPDYSSPIWQIVIKVQTGYRSEDVIAAEGTDDGIRWLFVGGSAKPESKSQMVALALAVRQAGAREILPGATIDIGYVADGPKAPGASAVSNPPKQYEAVYTPPPAGYVAPDQGSNGVDGRGDPLPDEPAFDDEPPF